MIATGYDKSQNLIFLFQIRTELLHDESGDSKYHADKIWFDNLLKDSFELSEDSGVEPAQHYLGMKVTRDNDKRTITLSTPALIESMIKDLEEGGHIKSDATVKQHPMSLFRNYLER